MTRGHWSCRASRFIDVAARDARSATRPDQTVVIQNRRIVSTGRRPSIPAGAHLIDARNKYLIPGLWDMHVHSGWPDIFFPLYLAHGITGVRDMGGDLEQPTGTLSIRFEQLRAARDQVAAHQLLGPRVVIGGIMLDGAPPFWPGSLVVKDAAEARQVVTTSSDEGWTSSRSTAVCRATHSSRSPTSRGGNGSRLLGMSRTPSRSLKHRMPGSARSSTLVSSHC
jgi:hypothetical protein